MNRIIARTLKSFAWLATTGIAFSANAATTVSNLSYWGNSYVNGYVYSQLNSEILGTSNIQINGPSASAGINTLASASWDIPKDRIALDPGYNLVTNYGQYGYSYSGQAKVLGNTLKASVATTSTDIDWENSNPNSTTIQGNAQANFTDQWLIAATPNHKAGSYGAALVKISLDGAFPAQANGYNSASAWLSASTTFTDSSGVNYQSSFSISANQGSYYTSGADNWTAYDWSNPGTVSVTKKLLFQYGTVFDLNMTLSTWSSGNGQASFFNTGKITEVFLPLEAQLQTGSLQSGSEGVTFGRILYASSLSDPNTNWDFGNGGGPIIPTVPEPGPYAMLLAGLGLMGVVARRRSTRQ